LKEGRNLNTPDLIENAGIMSTNAATKARESIPTNGKLADFPMPKNAQETLWTKVRHILPHREDIVVAGREVKGGIVIHPIIATALLGAVIAIGMNIRSEMNWQHDKLVTLSVQKEESDKRTAERAEELSKRLQNMDAVMIVLGRDIVKLQEVQKRRN
jgi:hypothetical protein